MVEGGPRVAASFLQAGLVDRWVQYMAPMVLGSGMTWPGQVPMAASGAGPFYLTRTANLDRDLLAIYDRRDFAATLARVTL